MTSTDIQKQQKKVLSQLEIVHNKIRNAWTMSELGVWGDVYKLLGYSNDYITKHTSIPFNKPVVYVELKEFLEKQVKDTLAKSTPSQSPAPDSLATSQLPIPANKVNGEVALTPKTEAATLVDEAVESEYNEKNNYGWVKSPREKGVFLYWFQKKAAAELVKKVIREGKSGVLLLAGTGTGKTFILGAFTDALFDSNYHEGKTFSHIPYLYITKTSVVEQTARVFKNFFSIKDEADMEIVNIEMLRSKGGKMWVKKEVKIVGGEEEEFWKWKYGIHPSVILLDESQGVKNGSSTQHKILSAYNELPMNSCIVSSSATPFLRVSEAKVFAVSTKRPLDHLPGFAPGSLLTNATWPMYASIIASPAKPEEYNQAAIERLMEDLKDYVVRVRGVRPQFDARNSVELIDFESKAKAEFYASAWERFIKEMKKLAEEKEMGGQVEGHIFTILLKFAMAAEMCHAEGFADRMYQDVQAGKAACCSVKFKGTIIEINRILREKYGVPRNLISLIWGGGPVQLTKKELAKKKIKENAEKFKAAGLDIQQMIADLDLTEIEDKEEMILKPEWRLGAQSLQQRQEEIDRFQSGKSLYCMYTFRSGGVGLSLHHSDELSPFKCRRKESGYAFEEDIPKVPIRPRVNHIAMTYNAIELIQSLGRTQRLTSLSSTVQKVYGYKGTVEADMGVIVSQKMRCATSVIKMKESWQDAILSYTAMSSKGRTVADILKTTENIKDDETGLLGDESEDEE